MKLLVVVGVTALLSLGSASQLSAQTAKQPGQVSVLTQLRSGLALEEYPSAEMPKVTVASLAINKHDRFMNRLWIASMVSAAAGTSLDAASSWEQRESNGFLASSDGRFEGKGLAIKAGFAAALLVPQICLRRHKDLKGPFAAGNFAEAAVFTAVSVHNFQLKNASR